MLLERNEVNPEKADRRSQTLLPWQSGVSVKESWGCYWNGPIRSLAAQQTGNQLSFSPSGHPSCLLPFQKDPQVLISKSKLKTSSFAHRARTLSRGTDLTKQNAKSATAGSLYMQGGKLPWMSSLWIAHLECLVISMMRSNYAIPFSAIVFVFVLTVLCIFVKPLRDYCSIQAKKKSNMKLPKLPLVPLPQVLNSPYSIRLSTLPSIHK